MNTREFDLNKFLPVEFISIESSHYISSGGIIWLSQSKAALYNIMDFMFGYTRGVILSNLLNWKALITKLENPTRVPLVHFRGYLTRLLCWKILPRRIL